MASKVFSAAVVGMECMTVEVEADILNSIPAFIIVGLGDTTVQESRERIRSAIKNSGLTYPLTKKVINLAPSEVKKHGPLYDLPIAVCLLIASKQLTAACVEKTLIVGQLALSGEVRGIQGVLAITHFAQKKGFKRIILPRQNAAEAGLIAGIEIIHVEHLIELVELLRGERVALPVPVQSAQDEEDLTGTLDDIVGHEAAKRALVIAAAGRHNVLMYGPPGSGKTILARGMASILPNLTTDEALEVTKIYSIAGLITSDAPLKKHPPFRMVHQTASGISLIGGGSIPRPGEITLAHHGVLFMDELLEFPRNVLDALRQPLEEGRIIVSRASWRCNFPARFMLVGATNPCPCGYYGDAQKACVCIPNALKRYRNKLSGPLLDRIDIVIPVPRVSPLLLHEDQPAHSPIDYKKMVTEAQDFAQARYKIHGLNIRANSDITHQEISITCGLTRDARNLLHTACTQFHYSGRASHRILKVARTIADLEKNEFIDEQHIAEALQYRPRFFE